jgi:RNA polymerase sigma-70 factor, ECF subfamily
MRALRERLSEDDQTLLVLRIDKELSWKEIAAVMSGRGEELDDAALRRWSARLRQRFRKVKERLRVMAKEEGII